MCIRHIGEDILTGAGLGLLVACLFVLLYIGKYEATISLLWIALVIIPAGSVFYIAMKVLLKVD
jgi:hypothetical protein